MVSGALLKGSDWSDSKCLKVICASILLKYRVIFLTGRYWYRYAALQVVLYWPGLTGPPQVF